MNELTISDINFRQIESCENYYVSKCGKIWNNKRKKFVKIRKRLSDGYWQTRIINNLGIRITIKLYRIIAETYLDNPLNKPEVNHIDGNKDNNDISNLEWSTRQHNMNHAYQTGLIGRGIQHPSGKLTDKDVTLIIEEYSKGIITQKELAIKWNVGQHHISRLVNKKRRKYLV